MTKENIILTGFMATGKTTVGKLLAEQMGYEFVDTDELIEERSGLKISEIFRKKGENAFRKISVRKIFFRRIFFWKVSSSFSSFFLFRIP